MKCSNSTQRVKWSEQENEKLKSLVKHHQSGNVINWREIAEELHHYGYKRTIKACKDRYAQYLDEKIDLKILNASEINNLFDLLKRHGNQWGLIAQKFQNRTQIQVKNSFYSTVRKIYRRLVKSVYKDVCSRRVSAIKCIYFSNMFCPNNISTRDQVYIDAEIKEKFQRLIFQKLNIKKNSILDDTTKLDVCYTLTYLEIKNLITNLKDSLEIQKRQDEVLLQVLKKRIQLQQANPIIVNLQSEKFECLQTKLNQFFNLQSSFMEVEQIEQLSSVMHVSDTENQYNYSLGSQYDTEVSFFTQYSSVPLINIF